MSFKTYFRLMLFFPIVLGGLLWAFSMTSYLSFVLMSSLFFAGIPYLLFAVVLNAWARKQSEKRVMFVASVMPVLFIPLSSIGMLIFSNAKTFNDAFGIITLGALYTLAVGYFYVVIGWAGFWGIRLLQRTKFRSI